MADEWVDDYEGPGISMASNNFSNFTTDDGDSGKPESSASDFHRSNDGNNYNDRNGKDGGGFTKRGGGGFGGGGRGGGRNNDRGGRSDRGGGSRGGYNNDRNNRRNQYDDAEENGKDEDNGNGYSNSNDRGDYHRGGDGGDGENRRGGRGRGGGGRGGGGRGGGRRNNDSEDQDGGDKSEQAGADTFNSEKPKEFYIPPEPTDDEAELFGNNISSGINFDKFNEIPINVSGENIPTAITAFANSGLRDFLIDNIQKSKYTTPTPIQKHAIPVVLNGRDLMACAQTGSGKTAAFLLPIIDKLLGDNAEMSIGKPQCVIVSPTRELTIQIYNEARKFSMGSFLKCCIVYGGTATRHQSGNVAKGCHLLIATPGRLLDFVDKGFVSFEDLKFIVLDEADRMLDMGFIPSMEKMFNHPSMPAHAERQTLMFSATFPDEIQRLAGQFLNNYIFVAIGIVGSACADVEQKFHQVTKFEKRKKLLDILKEEDTSGTLVFVETKRNADFLAALLSETEIPTTSIHGDRLQREREEALRDFKSQKMKILIATSVAARGLDIKNVAHVINYDMPKSIDDYVHRIGRTGRVGNRGRATALFDSEQDSGLVSDLVKILTQANQPVPEFLNNPGSGGGGYSGGGGGGRNNFGSKDVRKGVGHSDNRSEASQPLPDEPDAEW